jgi:TRAP-type C4-dicarboxylate transport system substrate-binding protein
MTRTRVVRLVSVLTVASLTALALGGCSDPPTRAGAALQPVTIRSGYGAGTGTVGADVLDTLVRETAGTAVVVGAPAPARDIDDEDGSAIPRLRAGEFDLAVLRADVLATAGARSLAVLQTPMLVTSEAQAQAVAADAVAQDLMAGLGAIDLVGLALVPGGLRHPFGYAAPLRGPGDYEGKAINARPGDGSEALVAALGATLDTTRGVARRARIKAGRIVGIEASLPQAAAVDLPAVLTSNVVLYTKFDVVVVHEPAWSRLSSGQRAVLRSAVARAAADTQQARDSEAEGLDRWCSTPTASSVTASAGEVAALRARLAPAVAAATAAPEAKALAERVAALGDGTTPPAGRECGSAAAPGASESPYVVERSGDQNVLDGTWRVQAEKQDLIDAGQSLHDATVNAGVWTLRIKDHVATVEQPNGPNCLWDFAFDGKRVSISFTHDGNDSCYGTVIGTYRRTGDLVTFDWEREKDYDVALDRALFQDGMRRIG